MRLCPFLRSRVISSSCMQSLSPYIYICKCRTSGFNLSNRLNLCSIFHTSLSPVATTSEWWGTMQFIWSWVHSAIVFVAVSVCLDSIVAIDAKEYSGTELLLSLASLFRIVFQLGDASTTGSIVRPASQIIQRFLGQIVSYRRQVFGHLRVFPTGLIIALALLLLNSG